MKIERASLLKYNKAAKTARRVGLFRSGIYKGTRHEGIYTRSVGDVSSKASY